MVATVMQNPGERPRAIVTVLYGVCMHEDDKLLSERRLVFIN